MAIRTASLESNSGPCSLPSRLLIRGCMTPVVTGDFRHLPCPYSEVLLPPPAPWPISPQHEETRNSAGAGEEQPWHFRTDHATIPRRHSVPRSKSMQCTSRWSRSTRTTIKSLDEPPVYMSAFPSCQALSPRRTCGVHHRDQVRAALPTWRRPAEQNIPVMRRALSTHARPGRIVRPSALTRPPPSPSRQDPVS
ncbi:hypothetical protein B0H13DRAFT_2445240 [Mycena leptocephala]|nr:hypothetical protein B0H13DRAFT_2445240 [Mycena leptocephala]